MDFPSPFLIAAIVAALIVAAVASKAAVAAVRNRRKERRVAQAKKLARSLVDSITRAIFSKNPAELQTIAENVAHINRLADVYGFPLHEIRASKQRLDRWMFLAEEILHNGGKTPAWRRLASLVNAPVNTINRNEPGTPDIALNEQLALPMTSTTTTEELGMTRPDEPRIIIPPAEPHPIHPIDAMIQEVMDMDLPPGQPMTIVQQPPEPKMVEVITVNDDGTSFSTLEPDDPGSLTIDIVVVEESDIEEESDVVREADIVGETEAALPFPEEPSIDEQVEKIFDKLVIPE